MFFAGCREESYSYRYRAGTWHEYRKIIESGTFGPDNPPPLVPVEGKLYGEWVAVTSSGRVVSDDEDWRGGRYSQMGRGYGDEGVEVGEDIYVFRPRFMMSFGGGYYHGSDSFYRSRFGFPVSYGGYPWYGCDEWFGGCCDWPMFYGPYCR